MADDASSKGDADASQRSCGAGSGRSQTLFIVPFRYRLDRRESDPRGEATRARFVRAVDGDRFDGSAAAKSGMPIRWRAQYLTGETRQVLFGFTDDTSPPTVVPTVGRRVFEYLLVEGDGSRKAFPRLGWKGPSGRCYEFHIEVRVVLFEQSSAARAVPSHRASACVGFLVVGARFPSGAPIDDLLAFNERVRHVRCAYASHADELHANRPDSLSAPPGWVEVVDPGLRAAVPPPASVAPPRASDLDVRLWDTLLRYPIETASERGTEVFSIVSDIAAYPDHRAFVATHVRAPDHALADASDIATSALWHQVLHVEPTARPTGSRREDALTPTETAWAAKRSYTRWAAGFDRGRRIWGFSNYSFASLFEADAWDAPDSHFRGSYLDLLLLVLYQRVTVFSFSRDMAALTEAWTRASDDAALRDVFERLSEFRACFSQFVNLYWFPVFTNQVQGLEMYEIARRELDNVELFDELRQEMQETWGVIDAARQQRVEDVERKFSKGATVFAVAGLLLAALGVSNLSAESDRAVYHWPPGTWFAFAAAATALTIVAWAVVVFRLSSAERRRALGERIASTLARLCGPVRPTRRRGA